MSDDLNHRAAMVQNHVRRQPWSSYGHEPVPVEIGFDRETWTVRYVLGLNSTGTKRRWGWESGDTLEAALRKARTRQYLDAADHREGEGNP